MIRSLGEILEDAEMRELNIGIARHVFDGGEWLLALLELEVFAEEDVKFRERWGSGLRQIREAMGDPPNPYEIIR